MYYVISDNVVSDVTIFISEHLTHAASKLFFEARALVFYIENYIEIYRKLYISRRMSRWPTA